MLGDTDYPSNRANVEKVANSAAGVVLMNGLVGFAQLIPLPAYLKYEDQKTASPTFIEDFDSDYRTFTRRHMEWSGITRTEKLRELVEIGQCSRQDPDAVSATAVEGVNRGSFALER